MLINYGAHVTYTSHITEIKERERERDTRRVYVDSKADIIQLIHDVSTVCGYFVVVVVFMVNPIKFNWNFMQISCHYSDG